MDLLTFFIRCAVYLCMFAAAWYGLSAVHYEKFLRQGYVKQAQILYVLMVMAIAYLAGSFLLSFIFR